MSTPTGRVVVNGRLRNLACIHRDYARALKKARALRGALLANGARVPDPFAPESKPAPRKGRQGSRRAVQPPALQGWAIVLPPDAGPLRAPTADVLWYPGMDEARDAYCRVAYGATTDAGIYRVAEERLRRFGKISRTLGAPAEDPPEGGPDA